MIPWTIPDELMHFVGRQFIYFGMPCSCEKSIDIIGDTVLDYVAKKDYFPRVPSETIERYNNPGLTELEKFYLAAPLEIQLKTTHFIDISFEQVQLCVWASLLWCWSEEGESYVRFVKQT